MPAIRNKLDEPLRPYWNKKDLFTTSLMAMLLDTYGPEALKWTPETIEIEIEQDNGIELSQDNFERLMVGIALLTTNNFFVSLPDFAHFCVVLSGHHVPPGQLLLPDADDCAWGITEGLLLSPADENDENLFSQEITAFLGAILDEEGIMTPPDVLRIATRELAGRQRYDFSDDPEMFNAVYDMEKRKTEAINFLIKGRMRGMLSQLLRLPLRTVSHDRVRKFVDKARLSLKGAADLPLVPV